MAACRLYWFSGGIGGSFQGYTIGNLLSAQFYAAEVAAHPGIPGEIARGEFGTLHRSAYCACLPAWAQVHPAELVERATGEPLTITPYLAYLRGKYSELYALPAAA